MNKVKVTLVRGIAGKTKNQKDNLLGLGFRKSQGSVVLEDTPSIRGMIYKVSHLVKVEEVKG